MKFRPNLSRRQFLQTTTLAVSALPFAGTGAGRASVPLEDLPETGSLTDSPVAEPLRRFIAEKKAQALRAAEVDGTELLPGFRSFFEAAERGDRRSMSSLFSALRSSGRSGGAAAPNGCWSRPVEMAAAREVLGAVEQFAESADIGLVKLGRGILALLPPGSIYFGGTEPGRFVITALSQSHVNADPCFVLTQNALADGGYLNYLRSMYGSRISIPSEAESTNAFSHYLNDALHRREQNKLLPGEMIEDVDGGLNVSGQVAVMAINGLLAKIIVDQNLNRECYVEESFPFEWMYPHLSPHGLILKINRQPMAELPEAVVQRDREYWSAATRPLLGDWLKADTPIEDVAAFAEQNSRPALRGRDGEPETVRTARPQAWISKLRSSIGGVYAWRASHATNSDERGRMLEQADFAFRQAFALCPQSPEAVFRYTTLLAGQKRMAEAIMLVRTAQKLEPEHAAFSQLLAQLKSKSLS